VLGGGINQAGWRIVTLRLMVVWTYAIASRLAPTGDLQRTGIRLRHKSTVGAGLLAIGGVSGSKDIGSAGLFASRLAPTGGASANRNAHARKSTVGASLLAIGGVPGSKGIESAGLFASRLAPTGELQRIGMPIRRKSTVGASLLAIGRERSPQVLVPEHKTYRSQKRTDRSQFGNLQLEVFV